MIEIYTDGAASNNGKENSIGGWGFVIVSEEDIAIAEGCGKIERGTNNQGEMTAITKALSHYLEYIDSSYHKVRVISDSSYCIKGITEWINNWKKNGWKTSAKKEVKNVSLWKEMDKYNNLLDIEWKWTRGHDGNKWNEYADKLAVKGRND